MADKIIENNQVSIMGKIDTGFTFSHQVFGCLLYTSGKIAVNQELTLLNHHDLDKRKKVKISKLYEFDGLNKIEVKESSVGSIVAISGIEDIHIGDTLCGGDNPEAIPFQKISEPTLSMNFLVNDSPLACLLYTSTWYVV